MKQLLIAFLFMSFVSCEPSFTNWQLINCIDTGMYISTVDSIMGKPDYVSEEIDTSSFRYNYYAPIGSSSDYGISLDKKDSVVVKIYLHEERP